MGFGFLIKIQCWLVGPWGNGPMIRSRTCKFNHWHVILLLSLNQDEWVSANHRFQCWAQYPLCSLCWVEPITWSPKVSRGDCRGFQHCWIHLPCEHWDYAGTGKLWIIKHKRLTWGRTLNHTSLVHLSFTIIGFSIECCLFWWLLTFLVKVLFHGCCQIPFTQWKHVDINTDHPHENLVKYFHSS